jgi:hypothetical protein
LYQSSGLVIFNISSAFLKYSRWLSISSQYLEWWCLNLDSSHSTSGYTACSVFRKDPL